MPIIKSAVKRAKQSSKRRDRNIEIKRAIKSATKAFMANPSADTLAKANSELDKAVKKGLLKKNTVARRKMRLSRIAKEAGVKVIAYDRLITDTDAVDFFATFNSFSATRSGAISIRLLFPRRRPPAKSRATWFPIILLTSTK